MSEDILARFLHSRHIYLISTRILAYKNFDTSVFAYKNFGTSVIAMNRAIKIIYSGQISIMWSIKFVNLYLNCQRIKV